MNNPNKPEPDHSALEGIPHLAAKAAMQWATPQLDSWLNQVLLDSRDGQRHGLPPEVCSEMLFLIELNKTVRAIDLAKALAIPYADAYQKVDMHDRGYADSDLARGMPHVDNV